MRDWLPALADALHAAPPRHLPRWVGRLAAGEAADGHDDRGRGAPRTPRPSASWAGGSATRAGARASPRGWTTAWRPVPPEDLYEELRPRAFAVAYRMLGSASEAEDVVQEALLRLHRALRRGERDRVAGRLDGGRRHPPQHRRAALGARPAGALRRRVAARAAGRTTRADDPARAGRALRLAVARLPGDAREPLARAARRLPAAGGLRLPLRRDRRDRRHQRGQRPPARRAGAPPRRGAAAAPSRRRARRVPSWRSASWPPPATATSPASRSCSPRTSSSTATAAARRRPWRARSTAAPAWPGR